MRTFHSGIINQTSHFIIAFVMTTFLHELAHAIAAMLFGIEATLFHTYVSYPETGVAPHQKASIAAAGPLFSLIQWVLVLVILKTSSVKNYTPFLWWLAVVGGIVFFGYVIMGPFVPYGDTGKIYTAFEVSQPVQYGLSILGLFGIILFFRVLTPVMSTYLHAAIGDQNHKWSTTVKQLFILPLMIGTVFNVLVSLPAPTPVSLVFPLVLPVMLTPSVIRILKASHNSEVKNIDSGKLNFLPIGVVVLLFLISRFLVDGFVM